MVGTQYNKTQNKKNALDLALTHHKGQTVTPEQIVKTAEQFEAFLNNEAPKEVTEADKKDTRQLLRD